MKNRLKIILGAGESGVGSAILAKKEGFEVFVSDFGAIKESYKVELEKRQIPYEEKTHEHAISLIDNRGDIEVIKSPGIAEKTPIIKHIREKNLHIISEIEFAGRYTKAKKICITGSNGKTTTTMLTYHILKQAGYNVGLAGNVGKSFAWQVAEHEFDYYVLELSSFQLDGMYDFKADIAILTNITPDHLDRYEYNFQNYINSKFRIIQNQTKDDCFIYWSGDEVVCREIASRRILSTMYPFGQGNNEQNQAFVENNNFIVKNSDQTNFINMPQEKISLKGTHNMYNSMAAAIASKIVGVDSDKLRRSLESFEGVEHRMEYVSSVRGVRYINDSKATNVNSCWYALQSMQTKVVLILGGTDKGNDYQDIADLVREKVAKLIFLGVDNEKLIKFFGDFITPQGERIPYYEARSMQECVSKAYDIAKEGDTVLLSPCCASFDLFKNYEDRGEQFKECVRRL